MKPWAERSPLDDVWTMQISRRHSVWKIRIQSLHYTQTEHTFPSYIRWLCAPNLKIPQYFWCETLPSHTFQEHTSVIDFFLNVKLGLQTNNSITFCLVGVRQCFGLFRPIRTTEKYPLVSLTSATLCFESYWARPLSSSLHIVDKNVCQVRDKDKFKSEAKIYG